jgi:hypothetical protein
MGAAAETPRHQHRNTRHPDALAPRPTWLPAEMPPHSRCSWQARLVAAAAACPILVVEPSSAAAIADNRPQLNVIR